MAATDDNLQHQAAVKPVRLASIDAYRGFVMFLMMAEVLHLRQVVGLLQKAGAEVVNPSGDFTLAEWLRRIGDNAQNVWSFLAHHQSHVEWHGCTLHDLIQPSFSFLVGVALPFSLLNRTARGQKTWKMVVHAAWRAILLTFLGIALRSVGREQTNFTFEDTLTQIGLGYFPLFLLGMARPRWQWIALIVILVGYWGAFAAYPLPESDFDYAAAGAPAEWSENDVGLAAHWNKNVNLAWAFDRWFLNLFGRSKPFAFNGGGYATLSFIPTLGTMILGLIAGGWLLRQWPGWKKVGILLLAGGVSTALGWAAEYFGICPIVKRIWSPAWVLYSGGWCFLILALFHAILDWANFRAWAFPLRVIGANSIAAYCMAHLFEGFIVKAFKTHLGPSIFKFWDPIYEPFLMGVAVLLVYWLILFWMYRNKIFIRI